MGRSKRSFGSYLIELLIIVVGISISFILNDWRESRIIKEQKNQLVLDIQDDLRADSIFLSKMQLAYSKMLRSHDSLLNHLDDSIPEDSLNIYSEHLTNYYLFNTRTRSFDIISNNEELKINKQDTSIRMFMNMHNYVYKTLNEWLSIEKNFVLNTATPYKIKHSPYIPDKPEEGFYKGMPFMNLERETNLLIF